MKAITVTDRAAGTAGVVAELGYGTTGLTVGQRVFGLADWTRDGTLAEYVAVEARNLAPLPADVDFVAGASLVISGLTAWQGLFQHGGLQAGQSVLVTGAAGGVGSLVTQLAKDAGALVIGAGRGPQRERILEAGAHRFVDVAGGELEQAGDVDLVFDVIGGDVGTRAAALLRPGGTLVTIPGPPALQRTDILARFFVVEPSRSELIGLVERVRSGRLRTFVGDVVSLEQAATAFGTGSGRGKPIVQVMVE